MSNRELGSDEKASNDILAGKIVFLRSLQRDDLEKTWQWMHMPDVYWAIGTEVPFSPGKQERWYESLNQSRDKFVFAICQKDAGVHIGNISLDMVDLRHRSARLSIFLASNSHRGRGYGSDALSIIIKYAFDFLNLHKLWCKTNACDDRLLKLYEKCGFEREGLLREHEFQNGRYVDKVLFGLVNKVSHK